MIGNLDEISKTSKLWAKIFQVFANDHLIGTSLQLQCPHHKNSTFELTTVPSSQPWTKFCREICNRKIPGLSKSSTYYCFNCKFRMVIKLIFSRL